MKKGGQEDGYFDGKKTTMQTFQRNPLRGTCTPINASNVCCIVRHLRTCSFDSHMCPIVNLLSFHPMNVLVDLYSSGPSTNGSTSRKLYNRVLAGRNINVSI